MLSRGSRRGLWENNIGKCKELLIKLRAPLHLSCSLYPRVKSAKRPTNRTSFAHVQKCSTCAFLRFDWSEIVFLFRNNFLSIGIHFVAWTRSRIIVISKHFPVIYFSSLETWIIYYLWRWREIAYRRKFSEEININYYFDRVRSQLQSTLHHQKEFFTTETVCKLASSLQKGTLYLGSVLRLIYQY